MVAVFATRCGLTIHHLVAGSTTPNTQINFRPFCRTTVTLESLGCSRILSGPSFSGGRIIAPAVRRRSMGKQGENSQRSSAARNRRDLVSEGNGQGASTLWLLLRKDSYFTPGQAFE
jgi:hypothetical protein